MAPPPRPALSTPEPSPTGAVLSGWPGRSPAAARVAGRAFSGRSDVGASHEALEATP